jgi:hypothetical protein
MIIVTGHAIAREGADEAMQRIAVEHVLRSCTEPGCISREVSLDAWAGDGRGHGRTPVTESMAWMEWPAIGERFDEPGSSDVAEEGLSRLRRRRHGTRTILVTPGSGFEPDHSAKIE